MLNRDQVQCSERAGTGVWEQGQCVGYMFEVVSLRIKTGQLSHSELSLLPDVLKALDSEPPCWA